MVLKVSPLNGGKSYSWNIHQRKDLPNHKTPNLLLKRLIKCIQQRRHIVALMGSLCHAVMQSHRLNISIAMVAMVNITNTMRTKQGNYATAECPAYTNTSVQEEHRGEFDWSPELQGYILSAVYLGFFLTQIPGGILAKIYGSKKPLVAGLFITSACNILSPLAARASPYMLMTLTLIKGMGQGIKQPAIHVLMSKWFPKQERGVLSTFVYTGFPIGALITGFAGGKLCDLEFLEGWPLTFYVFGFTSVLLAAVFMVFYYDTPEEDPRITEVELKHIQNNREKNNFSESLPTPWLSILLSVPFFSLTAALFGAYWMNYYFVSVHPIYLGEILNVPIKQNGILSAQPFISEAIAGYLTCYFCYKNKRFSAHTLRRGITSFSFVLFIIGMVGVYFAKCSILINNLFAHIALFGTGFAFGGCFISPVDMSPTFCGPLMGLASTVGCLAGFLAPIVAGELTNENQSLSQWGKVFLTGIGISFASGLIFQVFGSVEIQPYDPASSKYSEGSKTEQNGKKPEGGITISRL